MRPLRFAGFWVALWLIAIGVVAALSLLPPLPLSVPVQEGDKLLHLLGYALLMASAVQLFERPLILLCIALGLAGLGLLLEFGQDALTTNRLFEWQDAAANALGVLLGGLTVFTPLSRLLQGLFPAEGGGVERPHRRRQRR